MAKRIRINEEQLERLETLFLTQSKPYPEVRKQLAAEIQMTEKQVQIWFQNRYESALQSPFPDKGSAYVYPRANPYRWQPC